MDSSFDTSSTGSTPPAANQSPKTGSNGKSFNIFESVQEDREEEESPAARGLKVDTLPSSSSGTGGTLWQVEGVPSKPSPTAPSAGHSPAGAGASGATSLLLQDSYGGGSGSVIRPMNSEVEEEGFGQLLPASSSESYKYGAPGADLDRGGLHSILVRQPTQDSLPDQSPCVTLRTGSMRKKTPRVSGQSTPSTPAFPDIVLNSPAVPSKQVPLSDVYSYEASASYD